MYAALGTDRYPPFTLARADYPADIEVAYPEHPSRGLVLVKWLLAVPHLVVVGLIAGSHPPVLVDRHRLVRRPPAHRRLLDAQPARRPRRLLPADHRPYPRGLFDLLIGINRWRYRVLTYVALMHDEYPPFRLDQGPYEPVARGLADAQRTRFTGRIATAPSMAETPPTAYSTP